jgi:uncharacterized protein (TIGR02246 family)
MATDGSGRLPEGETMRLLSGSFVMLALLSPAAAGPSEEAFGVLEQFKKAFDASDPPNIVKLFAPDAVFLGTLMQGPTRDKAVILKYFQTAASTNPPRKIEIENYETIQVSDSAVLFSGQDTFYQTKDGEAVGAPARFTFVVTKGLDGWHIAHFHSSMRPKPQ